MMSNAWQLGSKTMTTALQPYDHSHENTIHSGHFMVSCVHEDVDEQQNEERDAVNDIGSVKQYPSIQTERELHSHDGSIDISLAGLFRQMALAYSGKLVSPKWKNFKGIKVKLKEKIRLNNIIWREWHMQYIQKKKSIVCQFEVPTFERTHCRPEAVILEGKYWKRQLQCLTTEYKKWRLYYKERLLKSTTRRAVTLEDMLDKLCDSENFVRLANEADSFEFDDQMLSDLESELLPNFEDDTFFSSIIHPFAFPDPREIAQEGFSRMAQPHLLQLQPTLADHMEVDFPDRNFRPSKRDPLIGQTSCECNQASLGETLKIDEIQRQLMDEEKEILKSSWSLGQEAALMPNGVDQRVKYDWQPPGRGDAFQMHRSFADGYANPTDDVVSLSTFPQPSLTSQAILQTPLQNLNHTLVHKENIFPQDFQQTQSFSNNFSTTDVRVQSDDLQFKRPVFCPPTPRDNATRVPVRGMIRSKQLANNRFDSHRFSLGNAKVATPLRRISGIISDDLDDGPEALKRRASTGSAAALSKTKDKKHVSFAVPNKPAHLSKLRLHRSINNAGDSSRPGVLKSSKSIQPSILEQLLLQGKIDRESRPDVPVAFQSLPEVALQQMNSSTNFPNNCSIVVSNNVEPLQLFHRQPDLSLLSSTTPLMSTPEQCHSFSQQTNVTTNPHFQIFVLPNSAAQDQKPPSQNPDILRISNDNPTFNLNLAMPGENIQFKPLQNFNAIVPSKDVVNLIDNPVQNYVNNQFALFLNCSQDASPLSTIVMDKSAPSSMNPHHSRSRHSSNESSGHNSDSLKDRKKTHHLSAEHQRRCMIKQGFDALNQLVPELANVGASKINKASTLSKAAEYCKILKREKEANLEMVRKCKSEVEQLTHEISELQQRLPASGMWASSSARTDRSAAIMKSYIYERTLNNWKFWVFSTILKSWIESYSESVVTYSREDMIKSIMMWLEKRCSLPALREGVLLSLPHLCKVTSILEDPSRLSQEAIAAAAYHHQF